MYVCTSFITCIKRTCYTIDEIMKKRMSNEKKNTICTEKTSIKNARN